jgi:predicted PurR-regulated permease PerM
LFLYFERAILTPFILAAIFAYLFNPVVNFFSNRIKLPRSVSIIIIYVLIISIFIAGSITLSKRILDESSELSQYAITLQVEAKRQI